MSDDSKTPTPSREELREICQTLSGLPVATVDLASRLEYVAGLVADAGPLPLKPLLVWRELSLGVQHRPIHEELVVGRQTEDSGLTFAHDKLLSRRHFVVRAEGDEIWLEDLKSRNGTAINQPKNRVNRNILRDGDLIYAGKHIIVFLNQAKII